MPESQRNVRSLVVFEVAGQAYALAADDVEQIMPLAEVDRPPHAPPLMFGFLNLAGSYVPVIRLQHLFQRPETSVNVWTPLVLLRERGRRLALLVDRVHQVLRVDDESVLPLPAGHALNDCVQGVLQSARGSVLVLSAARLLLQQEEEKIAELQAIEQRRLRECEGVGA